MAAFRKWIFSIFLILFQLNSVHAYRNLNEKSVNDPPSPAVQPAIRAIGDLCSYLFSNNPQFIATINSYSKTNNLDKLFTDLIKQLSSTMMKNNIPSDETILTNLTTSFRSTTNDSVLQTIVTAAMSYFSAYPSNSGSCFQPTLQSTYGEASPLAKGALSLCHFVLSDRNGFDTSTIDQFYTDATLNNAIEYVGQQIVVTDDSQPGMNINGTLYEKLIETLAIGGTVQVTWGNLFSALNELLTSYPPLYQPVCWFLPAYGAASGEVNCSCPTKASSYQPMLRASGDLCSFLFSDDNKVDVTAMSSYPKAKTLNELFKGLIQKLSSTMKTNNVQSNELILNDIISSFRTTTNDTSLQTVFNMATNYFSVYPSKSGECFQPKPLSSYGELNSIENGVLSLCNYFFSDKNGFDASKINQFYLLDPSVNEAIEFFGQQLIVKEDESGLNVNGSLWEKLIETLTASGTQQATWGDLFGGLNQLLKYYATQSQPDCWYLPASTGTKSTSECSCPSTSIALIAGVTAGAVAFVAIVIVIVVVYFKKFRHSTASPASVENKMYETDSK